MTKHFQRELDRLKKMILSLGAVVKERVNMAKTAIEKKDARLAKEIVKRDYEIDELEVETEEECLKALALYQPVAVDLRFIIAIIKINNDLERIGDQAVNIAERVEFIADQEVQDLVFDYSGMAEKAQRMLKMSLDALVNLDVDLALKVCHLDDGVDRIKVKAYDDIKAMVKQQPDRVGYFINLLLISRHLERLADHATNIAEEVIYMVEGEIVRHGKLD
jgi:phosphate transport system protein